MQTKYFDQILIFFMAVLAVFSGYQLYRPIDQLQTDSGNSVAEIISQVNTVKTKRNDWLAWLDSNIGFKLSENDMIYTHADSSAEIELNDGSILNLAESTLFRVSGSDNKEEFNLERGIVFAKLANSRKDIKVDIGGNKLQISAENAEFQISKEDNNQNISLLSGEMKIQNENGIQVIKENQEASFNGSQIKIKNIPLISLTPHKKIFYLAQPRNIHFKWVEKIQTSKTTLLVSTDRKFSNIYKTVSIQDQEAYIEMAKPGTYYWKLVGESQGETYSTPIRFFQVYQEFAPVPLGVQSPLITFEKTYSELKLQWTRQNFKKFSVEILFQDQPWLSKDISQNSLDLKNLEIGVYQYKVKGLSEDRPEALWSETINFEIVHLEKLNPVEIISPTKDSEIVLYDAEQSQISFAWKNSLGAHSYRFELKQNDQVQTLTTQSNFLTLPLQNEGVYQWRITSLNELQESSTDWISFSLKIAKDNALSPQNGSIVELKRPDQDVTFEWRADSKSQDPTYLLEVSDDSQFRNIKVKKKIKGIKSNVRFSKLGTYYWRTKILKSNGEIEFSKPTKVEVVPSPAPKPLELPEEKSIEIQFEKETSLWNWIIDQAFAAEGFIELNWPVNEDAKSYVVEIFSDPNMQKKVLEKQVQKNSFKWTDVTEGQYFWRVAIIDFWDRKGDFSNLSKLTTVYPDRYFDPEAVQLISPKHRTQIQKGTRFEWSASDKAQEYKFLVAQDLEFENIVFEMKTTKTNFNINSDLAKKLSDERYYWKVISIGKKGSEKSSLRRQVYVPQNKIETKKKDQNKTLAQSQKTLPFTKRKSVSALTLDALPSSFSEETTSTRTTDVSGTALNSIRVSYRRRISTWFEEFQLEGHRISGEVFQNLAFSQIYLSARGTHAYSWGNLSTGLNVYSVNAYPVQTTVQLQSSTLFALPVGLSKTFELNSHWSSELSAHAILGTILGMEARAHFNYTWNENFDLRTGIEYSNLSFTSNDNDVSLSRISLLMGISQLF